ncbi:MAG TPA: queuosine precursor transporter [Cytophagaceae bacterium]|jgi:hypothetical protein
MPSDTDINIIPKLINYERRKANLYLVLCAIFLSNAIVAEIIGVKIFSAEALLGLSPANIQLFESFPLSFNLTAGAIIWPIVFITTDIINEYFGKDGVKRISFLTATLIAYVFIMLWTSTELPPAKFWLEVNAKDNNGNLFNINYAFTSIFRQGLGIIVGSLVAFLIGQLLDVYIFHSIRKVTGDKMIWLRATGSTLVSQLVDSFVVLFIAFYVFGGKAQWSMQMVLSVGVINYIYKFLVALLLTPLLYLAHNIIDNYIGKGKSDDIPVEVR